MSLSEDRYLHVLIRLSLQGPGLISTQIVQYKSEKVFSNAISPTTADPVPGPVRRRAQDRGGTESEIPPNVRIS